MGYRITFDLPNLREGQEFMVLGLGTFANGSTYEFTQDQMDRFKAVQGKSFDEAFPTCMIEYVEDVPVININVPDVNNDNENTEGGN